MDGFVITIYTFQTHQQSESWANAVHLYFFQFIKYLYPRTTRFTSFSITTLTSYFTASNISIFRFSNSLILQDTTLFLSFKRIHVQHKKVQIHFYTFFAEFYYFFFRSKKTFLPDTLIGIPCQTI